MIREFWVNEINALFSTYRIRFQQWHQSSDKTTEQHAYGINHAGRHELSITEPSQYYLAEHVNYANHRNQNRCVRLCVTDFDGIVCQVHVRHIIPCVEEKVRYGE